MSVLGNSQLLMTPEGYQISRSVRLRSSASAYLNRTPGSASGQQTFTISAWVKRGAISAQQVMFGINSASTNIFTLAFLSGDTLRVFGRNAGSDVLNLTTTAVYRDPSAWYHIVLAIDTTQATASNRARMYVNGVEVTAFGTATYPAQNTSLAWNSNSYAHDIGRESTGNYFDGYLTEINHISGTQLTPSSFGETNPVTGVWQPKKYAGTYGTNGFYLNFSDNSAATATAIGKDSSGNGNNWTPNNISVTAGVTYDSMIDTPTPYADGGNGRGNYAVMNPVYVNSTGNPTVSNGNLTVLGQTYGKIGTISVNSGKWYWEATCVSQYASGYLQIGIADPTVQSVPTGPNPGVEYVSSANKRQNGGSLTAYGATWAANDVIGVALDMDGGTITFYKNGVSQGTAYSSLTGNFAPYLGGSGGSNSNSMSFNFGQRPFAYTPPTGFKALNTQNLPEPTIKKGNKYFNAVLYTGNGSTQSITGVGFQPDWTWIKSRSSGGQGHRLVDAVRGAPLSLKSHSTDAEYNDTTALTSFASDGFNLGTLTDVNGSGSTYVAWNWKANGAGVTNTAGSITSTVSANTTSGFSIVTFTGNGTGTTVGHGLGVVPSVIITKARNVSDDWHTLFYPMFPASQSVKLNSTQAASNTSVWNSTAPTSSVFTVDTGYLPNGRTMVAYCFAEVAGYSKFGSYTGNGSSDGPFVFCGFRPRYVMVKRTDAVHNWHILDTARDPRNAADYTLWANISDAEDTRLLYDFVDILSNGFKLRSSNSTNASGGTYIYAAFAEHPFKNALAR